MAAASDGRVVVVGQVFDVDVLVEVEVDDVVGLVVSVVVEVEVELVVGASEVDVVLEVEVVVGAAQSPPVQAFTQHWLAVVQADPFGKHPSEQTPSRQNP